MIDYFKYVALYIKERFLYLLAKDKGTLNFKLFVKGSTDPIPINKNTFPNFFKMCTNLNLKKLGLLDMLIWRVSSHFIAHELAKDISLGSGYLYEVERARLARISVKNKAIVYEIGLVLHSTRPNPLHKRKTFLLQISKGT